MTGAEVCLDCGEPMVPGLDGLPLCEECLRVAVLLKGSGAARVAQLRGKRGAS